MSRVDANGLLIIHAAETRQKMNDLLERMEADQAMRQLFVSDPTRVIKEFIVPEAGDVPAAEVSRGNRLLFSLLSNDGFMAWAAEFERNLRAQATEAMQLDDPAEALRAYLASTDRNRLHSDLAAGVARFADQELIANLLVTPASSSAVLVVPIVAIDSVIAVIAAFTVVGLLVALTVAAETAEGSVLVSRLDLATVANQLGQQLAARAAELRQQGGLTGYPLGGQE
jgi:hypothetical protein